MSTPPRTPPTRLQRWWWRSWPRMAWWRLTHPTLIMTLTEHGGTHSGRVQTLELAAGDEMSLTDGRNKRVLLLRLGHRRIDVHVWPEADERQIPADWGAGANPGA